MSRKSNLSSIEQLQKQLAKTKEKKQKEKTKTRRELGIVPKSKNISKKGYKKYADIMISDIVKQDTEAGKEKSKFLKKYQPTLQQKGKLSRDELLIRRMSDEINDKSYLDDNDEKSIELSDLKKIIKKYASKRIGNYYLTQFFNELNNLSMENQYEFLRDIRSNVNALDLLKQYKQEVVSEVLENISKEDVLKKVEEIKENKIKEILIKQRLEDAELFGEISEETGEIEEETGETGETEKTEKTTKIPKDIISEIDDMYKALPADEIEAILSKEFPDKNELYAKAKIELAEDAKEKILGKKDIKLREFTGPVYYIKSGEHFYFKGNKKEIENIFERYGDKLDMEKIIRDGLEVYRVPIEKLDVLKYTMKDYRKSKLKSAKKIENMLNVYIKDVYIDENASKKMIILGGETEQFYEKFKDELDIVKTPQETYILPFSNKQRLIEIINSMFRDVDIKKDISRGKIIYDKAFSRKCVNNFRNTPWLSSRADAIYIIPIEGDFSKYTLNRTITLPINNTETTAYLASNTFFLEQCNRFSGDKYFSDGVLNFYDVDDNFNKGEKYECYVVFKFGDEYIFYNEEMLEKEREYYSKKSIDFFNRLSALKNKVLNTFTKEELNNLSVVMNLVLYNAMKKVYKGLSTEEFDFIDEFININIEETLGETIFKFANIVSYFSPSIFNRTITFKQRVINGYYTEGVPDDIFLTLQNSSVFPEIYEYEKHKKERRQENESKREAEKQEKIALFESLVNRKSQKFYNEILLHFYNTIYKERKSILDLKNKKEGIINAEEYKKLDLKEDTFSKTISNCMNKLRDDITPKDLFVYIEKTDEGDKQYCFDLRNPDDDLYNGINPYTGNEIPQNIASHIKGLIRIKPSEKIEPEYITPNLLEKALEKVVNIEEKLGVKAREIILERKSIQDEYNIPDEDIEDISSKEEEIKQRVISTEEKRGMDQTTSTLKGEMVYDDILKDDKFIKDMCGYCNKFIENDSLKSIITVNGSPEMRKFCDLNCIKEKEFKEKTGKKTTENMILNKILKSIDSKDLKRYVKNLFKILKKDWKENIVYSNIDFLDIAKIENEEIYNANKDTLQAVVKKLLAGKILYYYGSPTSYKIIVLDKGKTSLREYNSMSKSKIDETEFPMDKNYRFIIENISEPGRIEKFAENCSKCHIQLDEEFPYRNKKDEVFCEMCSAMENNPETQKIIKKQQDLEDSEDKVCGWCEEAVDKPWRSGTWEDKTLHFCTKRCFGKYFPQDSTRIGKDITTLPVLPDIRGKDISSGAEEYIKSLEEKRSGGEKSKSRKESRDKTPDYTYKKISTLGMLKNIENSCYIDSVLFILLAIPNKYILSNIFKEKFNGDNCDKNTIDEIVKVLGQIYEGINSGEKFNCVDIKNILNKCPGIDIKDLQGESIEFLMKLFGILEFYPIKIEDQVYATNDVENIGNIGYVIDNIKGFKRGDVINTKSAIMFVDTYTILNPYYKSMDQFDPIVSDTILEDGYVLDGEEYLRKVNIITPDNKNIMIIGLNRTGLDDYGIAKKITKNIKITGKFGDKELYAIVCHIGGIDSGHYVSYFKYEDFTKKEDKEENTQSWFIYDDMTPSIKRVGKGTLEELKKHRYLPEQNGVLFFYKK